MEDGWLLHLRQRLAHLNGSIWVEEAWTPKLQRVGDASIMEALTNLSDVTTGELIAANNCRMYLRVITLSDIVTLDGRIIDKGLIDGSTRTDSQLRWPMQPKPTAQMLDTFRRLLKRAFSTNRRLPSTMPPSTLKKKSNSIAYHFVREGCARDEWRTTYINTHLNPADMLTKPLPLGEKRSKFVRMVLHHL